MILRIQLSRFSANSYQFFPAYVRHDLTHPAIYLDHWALMDFAQSSELGDRLVKGLRKSGGTLCLSHLHSGELCRVEDPRHAKEIDDLVRQLMPQVYCLDATANLKRRGLDDFKVIGDLKLAELMARLYGSNSNGYFEHVWRLRNRSPVRGALELGEIFDQSTQRMVETFKSIRQDESFRQRARKHYPQKGQAAGWMFLGELMRSLFLNLDEQLDQNDVVDIQHAINLLHCDLALLDRTWASKASQTRDRLNSAGVTIARCYSKKNGGMDQFLSALDTFSRS